MFIINKNQAPWPPCPVWEFLKRGQIYWAYMVNSFTNGVLWCDMDLWGKLWWRMMGRIDPGKRQGSAWVISQGLQRQMGCTRTKCIFYRKDHWKKLKQERWFQLVDSKQINNLCTPQHRVRYIQRRPGDLGILQHAERIREIIHGPIQKAYIDNTC